MNKTGSMETLCSKAKPSHNSKYYTMLIFFLNNQSKFYLKDIRFSGRKERAGLIKVNSLY